MNRFLTFKTEINPNNGQAKKLLATAGCARFAWNWALARRIKEYNETGRSPNAIEQHKELNSLKESEFSWMYEYSKCAPQESLRDLDKAYARFFRGDARFPKFKVKRGSSPSFRLSSGFCVSHRAVKIPKIGWVRLKEFGYIPCKSDGQSNKENDVHFLSMTIKQSASGRWFVSVGCEAEAPDAEIETSARTIGIDLGLKDFAVTSDGEKVEHPKFLKKKMKKLKRAQRTVSRRKKGGKNREKAKKKLAQAHYEVRCQRLDFLHKLTTNLVKTKPDVKFVVEDLNVKGTMKNHKLAGAIGDSGWGEMVRQLRYKAGPDRVIKADRWFPSTKMCSQCQRVKENVDLSERVYRCEYCGSEIGRDLNAAINLMKYEEYIARGVWAPRVSTVELPPVRREVTPAQVTSGEGRRGRKEARGLENEYLEEVSASFSRTV